MCPTRWPETRYLLIKLGQALQALDPLPALTPKEWFKDLEQLAWKLIGQSFGEGDSQALMNVALPPGFENFLTRWLTRAVNHAVGNRADEEEQQDEENMVEVLDRMQRTRIDTQTVALESGLDDILSRLGQTQLDEGPEQEKGDFEDYVEL